MVSTQGRAYSGSTLLCSEVYRARRELEGMVLLPTESAALIEYILRLRAHAKVGGWVLTGTHGAGMVLTGTHHGRHTRLSGAKRVLIVLLVLLDGCGLLLPRADAADQCSQPLR